MYKKFLSFFLCMLLCVSLAAPRAAATGVTGVALSVAEMAGVVSLIAGSLGIVFSGAGDMHDACEAFVRGLDPNSAAYLALASAVAQGSTIFIAGADAVSYLSGLVDSIRSFFLPGDNVVVEGNGVSITNLGQINSSGSSPSADSGVATFQVTESPVFFEDSNGNTVAQYSVSTDDNYGSSTSFRYIVLSVVDGSDYRNTMAMAFNQNSFLFFGVEGGKLFLYVSYINTATNIRSERKVTFVGPDFSVISSVSGGGEEAIDIPVFQEAGALSPDLVGGVWDRLAEDAAAQNGNVIIDTNVGTFQGGATGYVDGDPNGVISAPQAPSLGGAGSTRTETDSSTGSTSQTQTQTGTQAVPNSATSNPAISSAQATTTFNGATLTLAEIFPFCIPFDILSMFRGLAVGRETPHFDVRLFYPGWLDYTYTFDFSDFEDIASVLRTCELAAFAIGLAAVTRRFIKW